MARRLIGTATTDNNGVASITYTGVGAGILDIVAETSDGTLCSLPLEIYDCIKYDGGTSANHNDSMWTVPSNMTLTRLTDYSQITESNTTNAECYVTVPNGCVIEFDFKQVDGSLNQFFFNIRTTANNYKGGDNLYNVNGSLDTWIHLKIVIGNGTCTVYNGSNSHSSTYDISDANLRFGLNMSGDATEYHFKDFKVYPI